MKGFMKGDMKGEYKVKYRNIGKVIDEINENYGSVLNMTTCRKNIHKLNVNWNNYIPEYIAVYSQDRTNHWYIDNIRITNICNTTS